MAPPYPLSYIPVKKSWLDRNAGWKIPLGCLTLIVLAGGFFAVVFTVVETSFRKSVVYEQAIDRANRNAKVASQIGVPLRPGRIAQGQLKVSGSEGTAHMAIPVTGSRGKATIFLDARKSNQSWQFLTLQIQFEDQPDCLNLLVENEETNSSCNQ